MSIGEFCRLNGCAFDLAYKMARLNFIHCADSGQIRLTQRQAEILRQLCR